MGYLLFAHVQNPVVVVVMLDITMLYVPLMKVG
jgi:hypothetical protein